MKKTIVLLSLFCSIAISFGQEKPGHPIDKWLEECIAKDESTAGMVDCADKAYKKWDAELNKVYKELMKLLDAESQKKLKESQKAWIKFRDEEFKLLDSFYSKKDGTMFIPMHAFDRMDIVKNRVQELNGHLQIIKDM